MAVQERIAEMGLHDGDRMPSHATLAAELGISVPSLREGLQTLATLGVIQMEHGRGTIVRRPTISAALESIDSVLLARNYSIDECVDLLTSTLKRLIPEMCRVSTGTRTLESELATLREVRARGEAAEALRSFYRKLVFPLRRSLAMDLVDLAVRLLFANPGATESLLERVPDIAAQLNRLLAAVTDGDEERAHAVLREHDELLRNLVQTEHQLLCTTGSIGGTFYTASLEIAQALRERTRYVLRGVPSEGGIENIERLRTGEADLAFTQAHVASAAFLGEDPFGRPFSDLRVIGGTHYLDLWIVTSQESGIADLKGVEGQRVSMGTRGGETARISREILSIYGFDAQTVEQHYLSISRAAESLRSGEIDLLFYLTGGPGSALSELAERFSLRILGIDEDVLRVICERDPRRRQSTISVTPHTEPVSTVRVETLLVCRADLDDGVAGDVWEALFRAGQTSDLLEPAIPKEESSTVPVHPGVSRA